MIIKEIGIRGFKSFGNNEQILKLNTEKGELILIGGKNGGGKSAVLESFEFSLYGRVRSGKKKKWLTLSSLPNRINGELLNTIKFQSNGTDIEVKRGISPNKLELWENGVLNERAGKVNIDSMIEDYVGIDLETFKSFISLSINDFKNFISLSNEEKQLLLDKLFNLEVINILNGILKDLNKSNKVRMASLDSEIRTLDDSIESIRRSIERAIQKEKEQAELAKEREKEDLQAEIDLLTSEINQKKDLWKELKEKGDKIKEKESILTNEMDSERKQHILTTNDIKLVQKEIDLYDSGKCPTCSTDFTGDSFLELRATLTSKLENLKSILTEIESNITSIKEKQKKLLDISKKTTDSFNDLNYILKSKKSEIEKLTKKRAESKPIEVSSNANIDEFKNTISELEEKKNISNENVTVCKEKEMYYKELNRIFSEDGVKKSIISGIVKPINHFISENIKKMGLPFEVKLDETFTAEIKNLGNIVDHDSLSTGEQKMTNVCILIAYLMLIRSKKTLNVLFLDEVFSSIDLDNIHKILLLLKSFAAEYKINIFVVHHAVLNAEMFDRIILVEKNIFTTINELEYEKN
jgi:DNA repair exonuclease SbcCD ATPase subunit